MDVQRIITAAVKAALSAGEKILEVYNSDDFDVSLKDDNSPLTRADLLSQKTITEVLTAVFPEIPILGEEGGQAPFDERSSWNEFWLVDPLDGTKEFVKRNGEFTVNIALVRNRRPVAGVLYTPVKDELYFAAEGNGAYKMTDASKSGGEGLAVLIPDGDFPRLPLVHDRSIPPVVVVASRSHYSEETAAYVDGIKEKHGEVELISAGSALKICLVAEGKADVYPRFGPTMEWDVGAGQIIAEEAGCTLVNTETGEPLEYNKENLLNPYFIVTGAKL